MIETIAIVFYSVATISIGIVLYKQCKPKLMELKQKYINKNIDNYKYEAVSTTEYLNLNDLELNNINNINNINNHEEINLEEMNPEEMNPEEMNQEEMNQGEMNQGEMNSEENYNKLKIKKNEKTIINFT